VKTKTLTLPEDLLQLQAELTIMRSECLRMADRCQRLIRYYSPVEEPEMFDTGEPTSKEDNHEYKEEQVEMFDTGEPTSAYVNQDR